MNNIITIDDVRTYLQVSKSTKTDEFDKYIQRSQTLDLKPILGEKFYYDFITNLATNTDYQFLLSGGSYDADGSGNLIEFNGIKEILSYYVYDRFLRGNNEQLTRTGYVEKDTSQSLAVNYRNVMSKSAQILSDANQMKSTLIDYIEKNLSKFPLYPQRKTIDDNKKGLRMKAFRKTNYNR